MAEASTVRECIQPTSRVVISTVVAESETFPIIWMLVNVLVAAKRIELLDLRKLCTHK